MSLSQILKTFDDEKEIVKIENKYVEKDLGLVDLRGALQRARLKYTKEASPARRGVSFAPHAITYTYCRRIKVGQLAGLVDLYYDKITPRIQTGMDIGAYLHDMVQTYFWNVGMLKGTFQCLKCDKSYHNLISPTECPSGKKTHTRRHLRFREVTGSNEEYSLYGRCDGLVIPEEKDEILEIKSLPVRPFKNSNDFQFYFDDLATKGPREFHVVQLMLYMFMLQVFSGHLLYICKNDGRIKTFHIKYDRQMIEPYLREIKYLKDLAQDLKDGKAVDLPPCCGSDSCICHTIISPTPVS